MIAARPSDVAVALMRMSTERPDAVAVRDRRRELTFAELEARAAMLAADLVDAAEAAPTGTAIPLLLGPDADSVVALHAAVRAGLPFCPIDDTTPPDMVAELVARLGEPRVAVASSAAAGALVPSQVRVLAVPDGAGTRADPQPVAPDAVSMVLFTSGSTGRSKGVVSDWASLDGRMVLAIESLTEGLAGAMSAITSPFGFVAGFNRGMLPAVGCGVSVFGGADLDPVAMLERVDRERLDIVPMVPSLAAVVADRWPAGRRLESVRVVYTYGEPLEWEDVARLRGLVSPDAVIVSKYGASEATGEVLRHVIRADDPLGRGRVPMGSVFAQGWVRLEPTTDEPGAPSELVVVSRNGCLALGYLDDPELTASRFGKEPDGTRVWRSGDLAAVSPDGVYRHLGRADEMVKIRGKLVEPAEPERVLLEQPGVRSAVVLAHVAEGRAPQLVAHVVVDEALDVQPTELRAAVATRLPAHLVPAVFVRHDRLPLNARGKVDRAALAATPTRPWRTSAARAASHERERFAVAAARRVLGQDEVGPDDDLWEAGLDSLGAVELASILSESGWPGLEAAALLAERTPAALAGHHPEPRHASTLVWLSDATAAADDHSTRAVFLVPGAGSTAMSFRWLAGALGCDRRIGVCEPRGLHTAGRADLSVSAAGARAAADIRLAHAAGPLTVAGHSAGGLVALDAGRRLAQEGRDVHVVLLDTHWSGRLAGERRLRSRARSVALVTWLRLLPGRTLPVRHRYGAYFAAGGRAAQRFRPSDPGTPVTLVHVDGSAAPEQWRRAGIEVAPVAAPGDHLTMLDPPHASELARILATRPDASREGTG